MCMFVCVCVCVQDMLDASEGNEDVGILRVQVMVRKCALDTENSACGCVKTPTCFR
jgi:hypothetical protein